MKEMMIKVFNRLTVEKFITDLPHVLISVRNPELEKVKLPDNPNRIAELYLDFDDIDKDIEGFKRFTIEDAKAILGLLKVTLPYINTVIVNCEAGISRSAGIGAALSILLGVPEKDEKFFDPKGKFKPNRFVYRTLLDVAMGENWYVTQN